ncbi:MAG: hypothetical protein ABEJ69_00805 [Candidatus Nanohaloarchaea archaeon]
MPEPPVTRDEIENAPLKAKIRAGEEVVKLAVEEHGAENTVVAFTGDRDSTLAVWIVKQACERNDLDKPRLVYIEDSGSEVAREFARGIASEWGFELMEGSVEEQLEKGAEALVNSVRWDDVNEQFYSEQDDHLRVHPLLQFDDEDAWEATWFHMVPDVSGLEIEEYPESPGDLDANAEDLPVLPEYWSGEGKPVWLREPKETEGSEKDEKEIMDKLKQLGYM